MNIDRRFQKRINRYLVHREKVSLEAINGLDINGWFDFWHTHVDWQFKANRVKSQVAKITYGLLQQAESLLEKRHEPVQIWATLCDETGNNAIYIHSPNPNGTQYPYNFNGVEWNVLEPPEAEGLLKSSHEIGKYQYSGETIYVIRKKLTQ